MRSVAWFLPGSGMTEMRPHVSGITRRRFADFILFGVTAVELAVLLYLTPAFSIADWIYVPQHLLVFGIALTRHPPEVRDHSLPTAAVVVVAYA